MSEPADWAGRYVGIPYLDCGRSRTGTDCWGLVGLVLREVFGLEVPSYAGRYADAREVVEISALIRGERTQWTEIELGRERAGDVALLWVRRPSEATHVAVIVGGGRMLHMRFGQRSVIERYRSEFWRPRLVAIFRHRSGST